jgi:GTPase
LALMDTYLTMAEDAAEELKLPPEDDEGDTEYKLMLCDCTLLTLEHRKTQMNTRIAAGHGTCFYQIGVHDSGQVWGIEDEQILESLMTLWHISQSHKYRTKVEMVRVRRGLHGMSCMVKIQSEQKMTGIELVFADIH